MYSGLAPDDEWEPPKEGAQKEKIRQPRTKPKGFVNAKNQPKVSTGLTINEVVRPPRPLL